MWMASSREEEHETLCLRAMNRNSMTPPCSPTILATQCKDQGPEPFCFVVMNGSNRIGNTSSGTPGPLSEMLNCSGRDTRSFDPGTEKRIPGRKAVDSVIWAFWSAVNGLRGVFQQVQKHLHQLIMICENRRQRWVILLDNRDIGSKSRLGNRFNAAEHHVDVDRLALDRAFRQKTSPCGRPVQQCDRFHR